MVVALAYCDRKNERKLKKLCKKDSKQLTASQRQQILTELREFCGFLEVCLHADRITSEMEKISLNDIEARAMADLVKQVKDADFMIDLPDRYSWIFKERMAKCGVEKFEAEHKADENYPIVAAASIYAKVRRDAEVERIKAETKVDFGSGYPSDPKTRTALSGREMQEKISVHIRKKWKTLENLKQTKLIFD
ncbi:ribonuclease HII [Candidatus Micrarchaeota archaeon]|nr:ribonuclease HII [Candidatus Micrarchaeota archaeon]